MVRSDWGIVLAVVGCLGLAALGLNNSVETSYNTKRADSTRKQTDQIDRNRAGLPSLAESYVSNPDPKGANEKERRDLAAQEASAVWAFWVVVVSSVGTLITFGGTLLLLEQIRLTRQAVEDTGRATDAMGVANEIARESAGRQLRAYITVEPMGITDFGLEFYPPASLKIINTGQTPANRICVHNWNSIEGVTFDAEHFNPAHHRNILLPGIDSEISLGPGKDMKFAPPIMIDELRTEQERIKTGKSVIAHFGAVSYFDIYGERRETYFAFYYRYPLLDVNGAMMYRLGNYMT